MTPVNEYRQRLERREAAAARLTARHERIGLLRLAVFAAGVLIAWLSLGTGTLAAGWLLAPLALFVALVVHHARVRGERARAQRAVDFYRHGIARIEDRWIGQGAEGERFADAHHVYAADLDLFGRGSLFQLLCTARTRMGEAALAGWLLAPATREEILERQAAAHDLRDRLDFRERWAVLGDDGETRVHPEAMREWAEGRNLLTRGWIRPAAYAVPLATLATAVIWSTTGIATPFLVALLGAIAVVRALRSPLHDILHGIENGSADLKLLTALAVHLESEPFTAPALRDRARPLLCGEPASKALSRLTTLVQLSESRDNPILRVLNVPLAYSVHVALAAERWRRAHGSQVRAWLDAIAGLEALMSIAAYSYEHPQDVYPEVAEAEEAYFVGTGLGHPLMPQSRAVRNDVTLAQPNPALLISGSNMSGKSTLLRTVGVNAVLAMAGAPVRARSLRMTPLQIGASIRVNDSLHEGASRFYAEITRLRQLHELAGGRPPLLFLLDELLQGTHSDDRRVGAEGLLRSYLDQGGIGIVTTHDLRLTNLEPAPGRHIRNMHFHEDFDGDRMTFDYTLHEGPVTKSNGLALMRSIGLDV